MAMRRRRKRDLSPDNVLDIVRARVVPKLDLRSIEDRRVFHPERDNSPALSFSRRDQKRIVLKTKHVQREASNPFLSPRVGFAVPERVAKCVRRKQRREVIHALQLARRGAGSKHRRRDYWSDIDCR